jgi:hypothetical protein
MRAGRVQELRGTPRRWPCPGACRTDPLRGLAAVDVKALTDPVGLHARRGCVEQRLGSSGKSDRPQLESGARCCEPQCDAGGCQVQLRPRPGVRRGLVRRGRLVGVDYPVVCVRRVRGNRRPGGLRLAPCLPMLARRVRRMLMGELASTVGMTDRNRFGVLRGQLFRGRGIRAVRMQPRGAGVVGHGEVEPEMDPMPQRGSQENEGVQAEDRQRVRPCHPRSRAGAAGLEKDASTHAEDHERQSIRTGRVPPARKPAEEGRGRDRPQTPPPQGGAKSAGKRVEPPAGRPDAVQPDGRNRPAGRKPNIHVTRGQEPADQFVRGDSGRGGRHRTSSHNSSGRFSPFRERSPRTACP